MTVVFALVTPLFILLVIAAAPILSIFGPSYAAGYVPLVGAGVGELHDHAVRARFRHSDDDRRRKALVADRYSFAGAARRC